MRPYWVHPARLVATFDVPWAGTVLDISFTDHSPQAHFDIETVTWHYPSLTYEDPWHVLAAPAASIRLVTAVTAENPVLLLNRMLKLSAKYSLDLAADPYLADLVRQLADLTARWAPDDDFHGRYAHEAHLRHFHAAARRARDPVAFINSCPASGLLEARLAPLGRALRQSPGLAGALAARAAVLGRDEFWGYVDTMVPDGPGWRDYRPASPSADPYHVRVRPHGLLPTEGTIR